MFGTLKVLVLFLSVLFIFYNHVKRKDKIKVLEWTEMRIIKIILLYSVKTKMAFLISAVLFILYRPLRSYVCILGSDHVFCPDVVVCRASRMRTWLR